MFKQVRNAARIVGGIVFGVVGVIGVALPLIPGIPFLMLSAACFSSLEP